MPQEETNLLDFTHHFLMQRCDGEHANRLVASFRHTQYDLCTEAGLNAFKSLSYSDQVTYLVDYWISQMASAGIETTPESRLLTISQALDNFTHFMEISIPAIEYHDLPKVYI